MKLNGAWPLAIWGFFTRAYAIDLVFPSLSETDDLQFPMDQDGDVDIITGSQFSGLTTFANLPYTNCFVDAGVDEYDIAILGAPFDTVSFSCSVAPHHYSSLILSPILCAPVYCGSNCKNKVILNQFTAFAVGAGWREEPRAQRFLPPSLLFFAAYQQNPLYITHCTLPVSEILSIYRALLQGLVLALALLESDLVLAACLHRIAGVSTRVRHPKGILAPRVIGTRADRLLR